MYALFIRIHLRAQRPHVSENSLSGVSDSPGQSLCPLQIGRDAADEGKAVAMDLIEPGAQGSVGGEQVSIFEPGLLPQTECEDQSSLRRESVCPESPCLDSSAALTCDVSGGELHSKGCTLSVTTPTTCASMATGQIP